MKSSKNDVILSERSESKDLRTENLYAVDSAFGAGNTYNTKLPRSFDSACGSAQDDNIFLFRFLLLLRPYIVISLGNRTVMVVPFSGTLSNSTFAPKIRAACLTMLRPRPVPPTSLEWLLSAR